MLKITENDREEMEKMATSSFDKTFYIDKPDIIERLRDIMESDGEGEKNFYGTYTQADRDRSEAILEQYLSHSRA